MLHCIGRAATANIFSFHFAQNPAKLTLIFDGAQNVYLLVIIANNKCIVWYQPSFEIIEVLSNCLHLKIKFEIFMKVTHKL